MQNKVILDKDKLIFIYNNKNIPIKITRRKRKNISLKVTPPDNIEIISPKSTDISYLKQVIIDRENWVTNTLEKLKDIDNSFINRKYKNGEIFYYLGKPYKLKILKEERYGKEYCSINIEKENLVINTYNTEDYYIKEALKYWYRKESERIVFERIKYLKSKNEIMNNLEANVKIKEQKKRWGTCTSKANIYINLRISMAKIEAIDYIIIHEFSHLIHMNHSKDFYSLIYTIMPKFREAEKWLKNNNYKLSL